MRKLLLVEDDPSLGETLKERLIKETYGVVWVQTMQAAKAQILSESFDLIILDVGLPDGNGFELAKTIRAQVRTPFLFVTAMNSAEHRLDGYELGAEEYIPKPFHLKELLLRVRHVLDTHPPVLNEVKVGDMVIDLSAQSVVRAGGTKEYFASRDFQCLKFLIEMSPKVVSRDEILNSIWGEDKFPSHRTVDNTVVRLRQAIGDDGGRFIRSVRGVGYQWAVETAQGQSGESSAGSGGADGK